MTMQVIAHQEVGANGAASITFSDIPQTFTDLKLLVTARSSSTNEDITVTLNSGSSYASRRLLGTGTATASDSAYPQSLLRATSSSDTANTFSSGELTIPNYASANAKSLSGDSVSENNGSRAIQMLAAGSWTGTSAVTSITLTIAGQNFAQYSSATLIGIKSGSDGITSVS